MIRRTSSRLLALVVLAYLLGFAAFVVAMPGPAALVRTDAIVVPTGGTGRIARGAALLAQKSAKRMLISGVGMGVGRAALARENGLSRALLECCVDLDHEAGSTRDNAVQTARWLRTRGYRSVRLVTTDWHMPRAHFELARVIGPDVRIVVDGVRSEDSFAVLAREYTKYLLRRIAVLGGA